jgi:hypothetical protein
MFIRSKKRAERERERRREAESEEESEAFSLSSLSLLKSYRLSLWSAFVLSQLMARYDSAGKRFPSPTGTACGWKEARIT